VVLWDTIDAGHIVFVVHDHAVVVSSISTKSRHWLLQAGDSSVAGYHRFGDNLAVVLQGGGSTFHRPCPHRADDMAEARDQIEAKPSLTLPASSGPASRIFGDARGWDTFLPCRCTAPAAS
jgi:hypothetical protein